MYLYIYDSYLNDKKYEPVLNRIEARLADLSLNGRTAKMTLLKNMKETIDDGLRKGAETIVAVGNDQTLFDVIKIVAGKPATIGYIPVDTKSKIAQILDIPHDEKACDVLSARLCEQIDIGKINKHFFLSSVEVPSGAVSIECDGRYWVTPTSQNSYVQICNFDYLSEKGAASNPQDGILETVITSKDEPRGLLGRWLKSDSKKSVFPARRLKIVSRADSVTVLADGQKITKTPVSIEVAPKKLKIIVGKKRMF
ncbi:MAG: diacylglycerol kinase family protein [Patescibacteria group bacterium]